MCELYGWFERSGKGKLNADRLKKILRWCRRKFMVKYGWVPNLLVVRKDEYEDWMSNMGISVKQTDNNLAPKHFTLEFVETLK